VRRLDGRCREFGLGLQYFDSGFSQLHQRHNIRLGFGLEKIKGFGAETSLSTDGVGVLVSKKKGNKVRHFVINKGLALSLKTFWGQDTNGFKILYDLAD